MTTDKDAPAAGMVERIMRQIEDVMIDAEVDYPAGREVGPRVSYDDDAIRNYIFASLQAPQEAGVDVRNAAVAGWNACRRSIYAVCEDVQNEADRLRTTSKPGTPSEEHHAKGYYAGSCFAAKSIARGFNSMEAEDDDNLVAALSALSQPVATPAPRPQLGTIPNYPEYDNARIK